MIEKPIESELTVEEAREIDRASNNALYRATRTRSLKEFIPTGRGTSRANRILSAVSLSILPTNLSSSVGEQDADRRWKRRGSRVGLPGAYRDTPDLAAACSYEHKNLVAPPGIAGPLV